MRNDEQHSCKWGRVTIRQDSLGCSQLWSCSLWLFPCCLSPQAIITPTKSVSLNLLNNLLTPHIHARIQKSLSQVKGDVKSLIGYSSLNPAVPLPLKPSPHSSKVLCAYIITQINSFPLPHFQKCMCFFLFIFTLSSLFFHFRNAPLSRLLDCEFFRFK